MLKKKIKILSIIFLLLTITLSTISFADDETTLDAATILSNSASGTSSAGNDSTVVISTESESTESTTSEETSTETETTEESTETTSEEEVTINNYLGTDATYGDIYKISDSTDYTIDYNVSGNVFIIGNNVKISTSYIHGDIYIMGNDVTFENCEISGSVYVFANNFKMNDVVIYCSLYAAANNFDMYGYALDLYVTADTITLQEDSYVEKDFHSTSNTLNFYGIIGRNAFSTFSTINTSKDEKTVGAVFGNFEYSSSEEVKLPDDFVTGETKFTKQEIFKKSFKDLAIYILESIVFMLVIFGVLSKLSPNFTKNSSTVLSNNFGKVVLKGILFLILIPIIFILLILLMFTIKVAFILLAIYLILIAISNSVFVIALSKLISNKFKFDNKFGKIGIFVLTAIVYSVIFEIPYVGAIISIINAILGLGIILQSISKNKNNNDDTIAETKIEVTIDDKPETDETENIETSDEVIDESEDNDTSDEITDNSEDNDTSDGIADESKDNDEE